MPAVVLAKRWSRGELGTRGAMPCMEMIGLDEFAAEVDGLGMSWSVAEEEADVDVLHR